MQFVLQTDIQHSLLHPEGHVPEVITPCLFVDGMVSCYGSQNDSSEGCCSTTRPAKRERSRTLSIRPLQPGTQQTPELIKLLSSKSNLATAQQFQIIRISQQRSQTDEPAIGPPQPLESFLATFLIRQHQRFFEFKRE